MAMTGSLWESGIMEKKNEPPDYMTEHVFCRNRLPPRAYFLPSQHLLLSGRWRFHYASSPLEPDPPPHKENAWGLIDVPGHWQLQGYGHPHYTNFDYPFPAHPPYPPSDNPTGLYETDFAIPAHWEIDGGFTYRLRFEGVDSACHVWVNGKEVGYGQGSRNASEFDISDVVRGGERQRNTLRVKVYQWSDGSYIEDQDMWWLSGIFRDVSLLAFPKKGHVEDFFVRTQLDDHYKDATLDISCWLRLAASATITFQLFDATGHKILKPQSWDLDSSANSHNCEIDVPNPAKWTAEHPNLYRLSITLSAEGHTLQKIMQDVGFRKVELKEGLVQVNGRPITFRGVNRHDHHPRYGRAVPIDFIKHDLLLMKQHNVNAVRTSHYPNHPALVAFANEIGLWIMDEADLECHGMGVDGSQVMSDKPSWKGAYLDRMHQLVGRDKNNPSVIIWSLGNESMFGQNHVAMYQWSKSFDTTRLVHYEGGRPYVASDICSSMYNGIDDLVNLAHITEGQDSEKPVLIQEYGHAMGNGPGALKEYQETFYKYRRLQGGFIWEWANHGLLKKLDDGSGKSFYAYGGDFGDEPNDKNFVCDGLCTSEHLPGPGLIELKKVYQPITVTMKEDAVLVRNRFDFVSLAGLQYTWTISHFSPSGEEQELVSGTENLDAFKSEAGSEFSIGSFSSHVTKFHLSHRETWLKLSFRSQSKLRWAEYGHEIAWAEFRLDNNNEKAFKAPPSPSLPPPRISEIGGILRISTSNLAMAFDPIQAKILTWSYRGIDLISEDAGPKLTFWRAPTDNDKPRAANVWRGWRVHMMTQEVRSVEHHYFEESGSFEIVVKSWLAPKVLAWGFETTTTYTISSERKILIHVHASPQRNTPSILPRMGLEMMLPEDRTTVQWFGLGPGQSYRDMKEAGKIGIWRRDVDEMMVNYDMPQENGNRTETRWVKVTDERGIGMKATLHRPTDSDAVSSQHSRTSSADTQSDSSKRSSLGSWDMVRRPKEQSDSRPGRPGFDFAVSKYTAEDLDQAQHPYELKGSKGVNFRIDDDHHGLGSASCGPDTLEQHQLKMREFDFTVTLEATGV